MSSQSLAVMALKLMPLFGFITLSRIIFGWLQGVTHIHGSTVNKPDDASTNKFNAPTHPHPILRAPFYIYEDEMFRWDRNAWVQRYNESMPVPQWMVHAYSPIGKMNPKHSDDWWFLQAALRHPMRTTNASQAKLFFVPTLVNQMMARSSDGMFCKTNPFARNSTLCGEDLMRAADKKLLESPWFKRNRGKDHILVASHSNFKRRLPRFYKKKKRGELYYKAFPYCNILGYYDIKGSRFNRKDRLFIPKYYVSSPCSIEANKTADFALTATMNQKPTFRTRHAICDIMNKTNYIVPLCGEGEQCPTLAKAKFGFHVRGDKPSSQRLHDNLLSGTVPIFTLKVQFEHRPFWIDWNKLSYFADIENKSTFLDTINAIYHDAEGYERRHANILSNLDLFKWKSIVPFDTIMQVTLAHVHPEFSWPSNESLPYSALLQEHM